MAALGRVPDQQDWPEKGYLVEWFLAARSVAGLVDFRALSLFSFFEMVDGTKTMNGQSLAQLLDIPLEKAKALTRVRNEVSHGRLNLEQALRRHPELDAEFFGDQEVGSYADRPTSTFMNYLVHTANKLMLGAIACSVVPASWVGRGTQS